MGGSWFASPWEYPSNQWMDVLGSHSYVAMVL
jgi:hypothetical protein